MRKSQTAVLFLMGGSLLIALYLLLLSFGFFAPPKEAQVSEVPPGCQEIAWIGSATNFSTWERIVEAVRWVSSHDPIPGTGKKLVMEPRLGGADLKTDVPELALWVEGQPENKLYIRWYKFSSELEIPPLIRKLSQRQTPPLAIIGGTNTRRAVQISKVLDNYRQKWQGKAPLFLMTTATSDESPEEGVPLMDLYRDRNFRFSFTNSLMTEAVMDFVQTHPKVWQSPRLPVQDVIPMVGNRQPLSVALNWNAAESQHNYSMYIVSWEDDVYSIDLSGRFAKEFQARYPSPELLVSYPMPQNIGDYYTPSRHDIFALYLLREPLGEGKETRKFLVLPTNAQRARRFLRTMNKIAHEFVSNLVVLSGDSISFDHIYRDREVAWNILDLPVPLVFFAHRNPVDKQAGFRKLPTSEKPWATTSTANLLLYRDVFDAVIQPAFLEGNLIGHSDDLFQKMKELRWYEERVKLGPSGISLFDENRNRQKGTGEHVILLQPLRKGAIVEANSKISVWHRNENQFWRKRQHPDLSKVSYVDLRMELE